MASFQTKRFISIVASMVNRIRGTTSTITDFSIGGVARTIIEAPAQEIDQLYQEMVAGLLQAIPVATYRTFGFGLLPASYASQYLLVSIGVQAGPVLIQAGTSFTTPGSSVSYASSADVTIAAGNTSCDIPVIAGTVGAVGNLPAGSAFTPAQLPAGFVSAVNTVAFTSGADAETEPQRKLRFNGFISSLARGTVDALYYAANYLTYLTDANGFRTEQVVSSNVVEPFLLDSTKPTGLVNVYLFNGVGGTSGALVAQAQNVMLGTRTAGKKVAGYKAAGVVVVCYAATEQVVTPSATLTAATGYDHGALAAQVTAAWSAYILALPIGAPCILAELTDLAMNITGVANLVLAAGQSDTSAPVNVKLMPGAPVLN